jgi:hypothetical protein
MHTYRGNCFCSERSPGFISSELVERWLFSHYDEKHPERVEALRARMLAGNLRPITIIEGGQVVER